MGDPRSRHCKVCNGRGCVVCIPNLHCSICNGRGCHICNPVRWRWCNYCDKTIYKISDADWTEHIKGHKEEILRIKAHKGDVDPGVGPIPYVEPLPEAEALPEIEPEPEPKLPYVRVPEEEQK